MTYPLNVNINKKKHNSWIAFGTHMVHIVVKVWYSLPTTFSSSFIPET